MPHPEITAELTLFEQRVTEVFVRIADIMGIPKSVGEIYGLLFASAKPLSFQDIIDRLRISKGSASQGLRLLRANGAIKLVYIPGDRRDYFVPETELRALVSGFLREKVQPHLESGSARIEMLEELVRSVERDAGETEDTAAIRSRVEKLKSWQKKAKALVPIITKLFG